MEVDSGAVYYKGSVMQSFIFSLELTDNETINFSKISVCLLNKNCIFLQSVIIILTNILQRNMFNLV